MNLDEMQLIEQTGEPKRRDLGDDPEPDLKLRPEPPAVKPAAPPIYGRPWFGYIMGFIIAAGGTLKTFTLTRYIGVGILTLCRGYIDWAGINEDQRGEWINKMFEAIRAALTALEKLLKSLRRQV